MGCAASMPSASLPSLPLPSGTPGATGAAAPIEALLETGDSQLTFISRHLLSLPAGPESSGKVRYIRLVSRAALAAHPLIARHCAALLDILRRCEVYPCQFGFGSTGTSYGARVGGAASVGGQLQALTNASASERAALERLLFWRCGASDGLCKVFDARTAPPFTFISHRWAQGGRALGLHNELVLVLAAAPEEWIWLDCACAPQDEASFASGNCLKVIWNIDSILESCASVLPYYATDGLAFGEYSEYPFGSSNGLFALFCIAQGRVWPSQTEWRMDADQPENDNNNESLQESALQQRARGSPCREDSPYCSRELQEFLCSTIREGLTRQYGSGRRLWCTLEQQLGAAKMLRFWTLPGILHSPAPAPHPALAAALSALGDEVSAHGLPCSHLRHQPRRPDVAARQNLDELEKRFTLSLDVFATADIEPVTSILYHRGLFPACFSEATGTPFCPTIGSGGGGGSPAAGAASNCVRLPELGGRMFGWFPGRLGWDEEEHLLLSLEIPERFLRERGAHCTEISGPMAEDSSSSMVHLRLSLHGACAAVTQASVLPIFSGEGRWWLKGPTCTLCRIEGVSEDDCGACEEEGGGCFSDAGNADPRCVARILRAPTSGLAVLDSGLLVSNSGAGYCNSIRFWNASSREEMGKLTSYSSAEGRLAALPGGRFACAENNLRCYASVWDAATRTRICTLEGHTSYVNCVVALPGDLVATGSHDKTVRIHAAASGALVVALQGHAHFVYALAALPGGRLASASGDRTVRLWDLSSRACVQVLQHACRVLALAALEDGRLASGGADAAVQLWGGAACSQRQARLAGHTGPVRALAALPQGLLASGSDDASVRVWSVQAGACVAVLQGHGGSVRALAALPDGRLASASCGKEGRICVWAL